MAIFPETTGAQRGPVSAAHAIASGSRGPGPRGPGPRGPGARDSGARGRGDRGHGPCSGLRYSLSHGLCGALSHVLYFGLCCALSHSLCCGLFLGYPVAAAAEETASPLSLYATSDGSLLKGTLSLQFAQFFQDSSWFGASRANLGKKSDHWSEVVATPGLVGAYPLAGGGALYGRLSAVGALTSRVDSAGSTVGYGDGEWRWEDAHLGWRSGDLLSGLGEDALDLSIGRRQYTAGTGFLFFNQSGNSLGRGAYWTGERKAADLTALARLKTGPWGVDVLYLEADDLPDTHTRLAGLTLDRSLGELGSVGGGFYRVLDSDTPTRDGMSVYDVRVDLTPLAGVPALGLQGEYAYEDNGEALRASGWYAQASYRLDRVPWTPTVAYRYARFEGDDASSRRSEDFDPLFYGFSDWGYWYQGEVVGEYVLGNSNLDTHLLQVKATPSDTLTVRALYYDFRLRRPASLGVRSEDFARELDLALDWSVTEHLQMSAVAAHVRPDAGARELTGASERWSYFMVWGKLSF